MQTIIQEYIDAGLRLNAYDWEFIETIKDSKRQLTFFLERSLKDQEERDRDEDLQHYQFVTNN